MKLMDNNTLVLNEVVARTHPEYHEAEEGQPGLADLHTPGVTIKDADKCVNEDMTKQLHLVGSGSIGEVAAAQVIQELLNDHTRLLCWFVHLRKYKGIGQSHD